MTLEEAMTVFPPIWTIYDHPTDHPEYFVVRVWYGNFVTPEVWLRATLTGAREVVQGNGGDTCLGRFDEDQPQIVESWV